MAHIGAPLFWMLVSCGVTLALLWLFRPLGARFGLLDLPGGRKDHARPTPVVGGLAIAAGGVIAALVLLDSIGQGVLAFAVGGGLLLGVGVLDDRYDLSWRLRIAAQMAAALYMVYYGEVRIEHLGPVFGFEDWELGWASIPFTVFATVGLINAVNMIDGVDGLAGSLVLACLIMLTAASLYAGNAHMAGYLVILVGALVAFLCFNMRLPWQSSARVFMGNAGSAFLGYTIAWVSFRLTQNGGHPISPALALWLLPIPVMDCLVVMLRRVRQGKSPFAADHGHIHHFLRQAGFSPIQICMFLAGFSGLLGLMAGQALRFDVPEPVLLLGFLGLCAGWYMLSAHPERATSALRLAGQLCMPRYPPGVPADTGRFTHDVHARSGPSSAVDL